MGKIKAGVVGATGYAGAELIRLLLCHPNVVLQAVSSKSFEGELIASVYSNLLGRCGEILCSQQEVISQCNVVFACLPHGLSEPLALQCIQSDTKFIDLGADFRLDDLDQYEKWYQKRYQYPDLHSLSAYCIPELHRKRIKGKMIIANPGCYPTSVALALAPALTHGLCSHDIIIDSKSGVTGAGRNLSLNTHFSECNEAFSAYKVASHRHTPEIEQTLSQLAGQKITVTFVPHLLPINRGILSTIYAPLCGKSLQEMYEIYENFYKNESFVRILPLGTAANLKNVKYSNYCDISLHADVENKRFILCSVIDNMVKGAAGQAIQNMNLLYEWEESTGLAMIAPAF